MLSESGNDVDVAWEGKELGGMGMTDEEEGTFSFDKWGASDVEVRSWVKRKGGKDESDLEGDSPAQRENKMKKEDGLVKLIEWVVAWRQSSMTLYLLACH